MERQSAMRMPRSRTASTCIRAGVLLGLILGMPAIDAAAESYPSKPIKLISVGSPGSPPDMTARLIAEQLEDRLRQSVTVENRPGAGSTIATRAGAAADPDGHTLLQVNAALTYAPALYPNVGYDPIKSFAPVAALAGWSLLVVVSADVPANNVQELVAYAKANPGRLNVGYAIGQPPQILAELFKSVTGAPLNGVSYRQLSQLTADLVEGRIQVFFTVAPGVVSLIQQGRLKALAYCGTTRFAALPQVPTVIEAGLPQLALNPSDWVGIVAPARTPPQAIDKLNATINEALVSPKVKATFARLGWDTKIASPQEFATFIATEAKKWPTIIEKAGLKNSGLNTN